MQREEGRVKGGKTQERVKDLEKSKGDRQAPHYRL